MIQSLAYAMSLRTPDPLYTHIATWRLQWDYSLGVYFDRLHALCRIQFERAVLYENGLYMLQFSIVVKNVAQHLWMQYRLCDFVWCFIFCCMPSCNCFAWLAEWQVSDIMWSSENVPPRCSHKICSCTHVVGKYSVHHMLQTRTYCKKKICTQLTRLVKLDLSVKD